MAMTVKSAVQGAVDKIQQAFRKVVGGAKKTPPKTAAKADARSAGATATAKRATDKGKRAQDDVKRSGAPAAGKAKPKSKSRRKARR